VSSENGGHGEIGEDRTNDGQVRCCVHLESRTASAELNSQLGIERII